MPQITLDLPASFLASLTASLARLGVSESELPALLAAHLAAFALAQEPATLLAHHTFPHREAAEHAASAHFESFMGEDAIALAFRDEEGEALAELFPNDLADDFHAAGVFLNDLGNGIDSDAL